MSFRESVLREPARNTCNWFFDLEVYRKWEERSDPSLFGRFLWLKGKPGAGKLILVREAVERARNRRDAGTELVIGTFFFNARGIRLECAPIGMWRSLCWHIFRQDDHFKGYIMDHFRAKSRFARDNWLPGEEELRGLLLHAFRTRPALAPRVVLLNECNQSCIRETVRNLTALLETAEESGQQLDLCMSSRHYPTIMSPRSFDIIVKDRNHGNILCYIQDRIPVEIIPNHKSVSLLHSLLLQRSSGIFL